MSSAPTGGLPLHIVAQKPDRLRALDGMRGAALFLMLVSHSMQLFPAGDNPSWAWKMINGFLLLTKTATPLFIWVFGLTMAYVYYARLQNHDSFDRLKGHLWKRALLVFLSHQLLIVVVEVGQGASLDFIIGRLLYLRLGAWVEVLNFYLVVLLLSPWLTRWWRSMRLMLRGIIVPALYILGMFMSQIEVPSSIIVLKNIITSYASTNPVAAGEDTFPVLQLSAFYLLGLSFGESLDARLRGDGLLVLIRRTVILGVVCGVGSLLWSGDTIALYLRAMVKDFYKFPPQPPYILFGFAGVLLITALCLWAFEVRKWDNIFLRMVELLGRNSLFTFNVQYIILFTVFGNVLGLLLIQPAEGILVYTSLVIILCFLAAYVWERFFKQRNAGKQLR